MHAVFVLFTATKNGNQLLAVWRMIQKFAFSAESGGAPQVALSETKMLIYICAVLSTRVVWLLCGRTA